LILEFYEVESYRKQCLTPNSKSVSSQKFIELGTEFKYNALSFDIILFLLAEDEVNEVAKKVAKSNPITRSQQFKQAVQEEVQKRKQGTVC
jgi:hypothetical protein